MGEIIFNVSFKSQPIKNRREPFKTFVTPWSMQACLLIRYDILFSPVLPGEIGQGIVPLLRRFTMSVSLLWCRRCNCPPSSSTSASLPRSEAVVSWLSREVKTGGSLCFLTGFFRWLLEDSPVRESPTEDRRNIHWEIRQLNLSLKTAEEEKVH